MIDKSMELLKRYGWALFLPLICAIALAIGRINAPLCDSSAGISTWLDTNADGVREEDEPPLAGVCVGYSYSSSNPESYNSSALCDENYETTDQDGSWGDFMAGSCSEDFYVYAVVPDGYQPTTDIAIDGYWGDFGFVQKDVKVTHDVVTMEEFAHRQSREIRLQIFSTVLMGALIIVSTFGGIVWLNRKI